MKFLVQIAGAKKGIEVGTFTGYSALCMAEGLPADGKLICLDINEDWLNVGKPFLQQAGVMDKIDVRIAPALESLDKILATEGEAGTFDFAYVDADKPNYPNYLPRLVELLRPGGFIMMDNTLWSGKVADPAQREND